MTALCMVGVDALKIRTLVTIGDTIYMYVMVFLRYNIRTHRFKTIAERTTILFNQSSLVP